MGAHSLNQIVSSEMKMSTPKYCIFSLLASILAFSCLDVIESKFEESKFEYLIVNAELKNSNKRHIIHLKLNSEEGNNFRSNFPVEDAEVFVMKDETSRIDFLHRTQGQYFNINLNFDVGSSYVLHIVYKNMKFRSHPEIYQGNLPIDFLHTNRSNEKLKNAANNIIDQQQVNLLLDNQFPTSEEVYVRYRVRGTFQYEEVVTAQDFDPVVCFVDEIIDFDNITIANNLEIQEGLLRNHEIISRPIDYKFSFNYCMTVYQERISKNSYEFWEDVIYEYNRKGDIFEKPPGILRGNMVEEESSEIGVTGLFSMIGVDSLSKLITPFDAGFPDSECGRFGQLAESCLNCLLINKSTLRKPECFP